MRPWKLHLIVVTGAAVAGLTISLLAPADARMIPLTVPEIRRLLAARLATPAPPGHAEHWPAWRRRHQARSRWYHQSTRLARDN
jgi:hypothetical protein